MNDAYLAALSAISGSVIGALATLGTTWVSQRTQERAEHHIRAVSRRQQLYEEFMEEASKVYSDALVHELGDLSKLVRLYALMSKLRLFAPAHILAHADEIAAKLIAAGRAPDEPAAIVSDATFGKQAVRVTTLGELGARAKESDAPAALVIGENVRLREGLDWIGAIGGKLLDPDPLKRDGFSDAV